MNRNAAIVLAAACGLAASARAVIIPVHPVGGEIVPIVPPEQKEVMSLGSIEERIALFNSEKGPTNRFATCKTWHKCQPLRIQIKMNNKEWCGWRVEIGKKPDLSDARSFYVDQPTIDETTWTGVYRSGYIPNANLEADTTYYWRIVHRRKCSWCFCGPTHGCAKSKDVTYSPIAEFRTEDAAPRWIALDGRTANVRDLGGRRGLDGRKVRQGLVYRGQGLNDNSHTGEERGTARLTTDDIAYLTQTLGIRSDLDLRTPTETAGLDVSPLGPSVRLVKRSSAFYKGIFEKEGMQTMAENFRHFCDRANYPVYFHCIGGADRTGSLAFVLNLTLGVSLNEAETDWESTFYPGIPDMSADTNSWCRESHLINGLKKYGGVDDSWTERAVLYLKDCGVTDEEIATFRDIMLEPKKEPTEEWPFMILRCYGHYEANSNFINRAFAAQTRHPGLLDEIWFGGSDGFGTPEWNGKVAGGKNLAALDACRRLGIKFSYQVNTIGPADDGVKRKGFPDDCWQVDRNGKICYGFLCCTSPFARDYTRRRTRAILAAAKFDSLWPDDDLRYYKGNLEQPCVCFCDRCVKLFNEATSNSFTRATLVKALLDDGDAAVRAAWCDFNGHQLGDFAKIYREVVDAVSPTTRLGIQSAISGNAVDGESTKHILAALAGKNGKAGIRPGAYYYVDSHPREMLPKMLNVGRESARSLRLPFCGQACYEAETWPHCGAHKNPGGMMAECALALASGCDSLALYWGADVNSQATDAYDWFFETLAAWKPLFLAERRAFRGTFLGGVALYLGADHFATKEWTNYDDNQLAELAANALPVTTTAADPDAYFLNERAVRTLTTNDLKTVFSRAVLMDTATFAALGKRFPGLGFTKKAEVRSFAAVAALSDANNSGIEKFGATGRAALVQALVYPKAKDVVCLSAMTADTNACGTCVIPTEFGGAAVVAQDMMTTWMNRAWPDARRHAILDGLDQAVKGGLPARVLTDGYALSVSVRKTAEGKTAGVFVMNLGTGETPPLRLAIRRGVTDDWAVVLPKREPVAAPLVKIESNEAALTLPSLPAFGVVLAVPRK